MGVGSEYAPLPAFSTPDRCLSIENGPYSSGAISSGALLDEKVQVQGGQGTFYSSLVNLTASMMGAGIISLPYSLRCAGYLVGCGSLVLVAALTLLSLFVLIHVCRETGSVGYEDLARRLLGRWGVWTVQTCLVMCLFGGVLIYIIVCTNIVESFLARFTIHLARPITTLLIVFIIAPPCYIRTLHNVRWFSLASFGCLLFLVGSVYYKSFEHGVTLPEKLEAVGQTAGVFLSIPMQSLAFGCHVNLVLMYGELKVEQKRVAGVVASMVTLLGLVLYSSFGLIGYFAFASTTQDDILKNFPSNDVLMITAKTLIAVCLILKTPLLLQPLRRLVDSLVFPTAEDGTAPPHCPRTRCNILTTALLFSAYVFSAFSSRLDRAMAIVGATGGVGIGFVFPGMFLLALYSKRRYDPANRYLLLVAYVLVVMGAILSVCSLGATIANWSGVIKIASDV
eukprot:GILJ01001534.1.p1 GENE.GILJ01001534.1~~GILJ01001534.1.p1  ORF type:complete len:452 (-),score=47.63 GILJ01001534.1:151-1506(-)